MEKWLACSGVIGILDCDIEWEISCCRVLGIAIEGRRDVEGVVNGVTGPPLDDIELADALSYCESPRGISRLIPDKAKVSIMLKMKGEYTGLGPG